MTYGTINVKLRPIKFAFLVDHRDKNALLESISINSFLWGGSFNPIIPVYNQSPRIWRETLGKGPNPKEIIEGYLDAYDPDFVVLTGKLTAPSVDFGNRQVIQASEILAGVKKDGIPRYGIGLFEIVNSFINKELEFIRKVPLDVIWPSFGRTNNLFMSSVFGILPKDSEDIFKNKFADALGAKQISCNIENFTDYFRPTKLFPRRLTSFLIKPVRNNAWNRGACIFFLDVKNPLDIIDYWNLRAMGWTVLPVPKQVAFTSNIKELASEFIDENYFPDRHNPHYYYRTTLLKSRSTSEKEIEDFAKSLKVPDPIKPEVPKFISQHLYPRIHDGWARDKDGVECCELVVREIEHDIPENQDKIKFKSLDPEFNVRFSGKQRFANDLKFSVYGGNEMVAEVIPEGNRNLVRAIGLIGLAEWRFSKRGISYLAKYSNRSVHISVPKAEKVFSEWLLSQGWKVELSPAGRIAKQMIKQLGGIWGISVIADEGIIKLLQTMNSGGVGNVKDLLKKIDDLSKLLKNRGMDETSDEFVKCLKTLSQTLFSLGSIDHSMPHEKFWAEISKISSQQSFKTDVKRVVQNLMDAHMFRLGITVQCPICTQHSWYSIDDAGYELQCSKCLEHFPIPSHSPDDIKWSYCTFGPFSLPNQSYGVFSVLLTLRFFSQVLEAAITPMMSFDASKENKIKLEADLGLLFQKSKFRTSATELIFVECKTYNNIEMRDVERMSFLGNQFPGAVLVFATLKRSLAEKEKKILRPLVNRGRKYWKADHPFNPVLILTGIELFAESELEEAWKEAGGTHAKFAGNYRLSDDLFELCDATQQLYLNMKSRYEWLEKIEKKKDIAH